MVLRMMADVVALKPRYLHIMAATNDVAGNTGPITLAQTFDNFRMMTAIAQANRDRGAARLGSARRSFPVAAGAGDGETDPRDQCMAQDLCEDAGATWIDYWPVLADEKGAMKPGLATDGVHPTEQGYDMMATVIEPFLRARKI
jgi:lysophospholipase L1-like esterase